MFFPFFKNTYGDFLMYKALVELKAVKSTGIQKQIYGPFSPVVQSWVVWLTLTAPVIKSNNS